jgi:AcrR family transcriptional regulator
LATRIPAQTATMRKDPRQARSRATTEAILDAAARILGERGWQGLTTNAAAELAGVSIGSLYQYFPNKLALVEAVRRRHFDEVLSVLRAAANVRLSRMRRIEALVDGMIAVHSRHPAAHRVLIEESPRGGDTRGTHDSFHLGCQSAYEALVRTHSGTTGDVPVVAQVLAAALAGAVHDAARQGTLGSPKLRAELVHLVSAYLTTRRASGAGNSPPPGP